MACQPHEATQSSRGRPRPPVNDKRSRGVDSMRNCTINPLFNSAACRTSSMRSGCRARAITKCSSPPFGTRTESISITLRFTRSGRYLSHAVNDDGRAARNASAPDACPLVVSAASQFFTEPFVRPFRINGTRKASASWILRLSIPRSSGVLTVRTPGTALFRGSEP